MKRFVVVGAFFLAMFWQSGFAQMKDAQYMIGGGVSASFTTYGPLSYLSSGFFASLYPSLGVFVSDRLVLGGQFNAQYGNYKTAVNLNYFEINFGLAPMARYFWSDLANSFVGFSQIACGGNYILFQDQSISIPEFSFRATAATGVSWFVVPNVGIEAALQYTYATYYPVNLQLVVGVQAYISRK